MKNICFCTLQMSVRTKLVAGRPTRPTLGLTINRDVEYLQVRSWRKISFCLLAFSPDCVSVRLRYTLVITSRCGGGACACICSLSLGSTADAAP